MIQLQLTIYYMNHYLKTIPKDMIMHAYVCNSKKSNMAMIEQKMTNNNSKKFINTALCMYTVWNEIHIEICL